MLLAWCWEEFNVVVLNSNIATTAVYNVKGEKGNQAQLGVNHKATSAKHSSYTFHQLGMLSNKLIRVYIIVPKLAV